MDNRGRSMPADSDVIELPAALRDLVDCPTGWRRWGPHETEALRQHYPNFAARGLLPELADHWEEMTGVPRTQTQLASKAQRLGLMGRRSV